jgi:hypothetical protein
MLKVRLAVVSLGLAILLPAATTLFAQTTVQAPAAPIPAQILNAKKVFVANAGGGLDPKLWSEGPAQPYNELYATIKSSEQYQLAASTADADLVLQISYADPLTDVGGTKDSGSVSSNTPQLKLALLDPKTGIVLWTFSEKTSTAHLVKGRDHALADAINKLVSDLKALTAQPAASTK